MGYARQRTHSHSILYLNIIISLISSLLLTIIVAQFTSSSIDPSELNYKCESQASMRPIELNKDFALLAGDILDIRINVGGSVKYIQPELSNTLSYDECSEIPLIVTDDPNEFTQFLVVPIAVIDHDLLNTIYSNVNFSPTPTDTTLVSTIQFVHVASGRILGTTASHTPVLLPSTLSTPCFNTIDDYEVIWDLNIHNIKDVDMEAYLDQYTYKAPPTGVANVNTTILQSDQANMTDLDYKTTQNATVPIPQYLDMGENLMSKRGGFVPLSANTTSIEPLIPENAPNTTTAPLKPSQKQSDLSYFQSYYKHLDKSKDGTSSTIAMNSGVPQFVSQNGPASLGQSHRWTIQQQRFEKAIKSIQNRPKQAPNQNNTSTDPLVKDQQQDPQISLEYNITRSLYFERFQHDFNSYILDYIVPTNTNLAVFDPILSLNSTSNTILLNMLQLNDNNSCSLISDSNSTQSRQILQHFAENTAQDSNNTILKTSQIPLKMIKSIASLLSLIYQAIYTSGSQLPIIYVKNATLTDTKVVYKLPPVLQICSHFLTVKPTEPDSLNPKNTNDIGNCSITNEELTQLVLIYLYTKNYNSMVTMVKNSNNVHYEQINLNLYNSHQHSSIKQSQFFTPPQEANNFADLSSVHYDSGENLCNLLLLQDRQLSDVIKETLKSEMDFVTTLPTNSTPQTNVSVEQNPIQLTAVHTSLLFHHILTTILLQNHKIENNIIKLIISHLNSSDTMSYLHEFMHYIASHSILPDNNNSHIYLSKITKQDLSMINQEIITLLTTSRIQFLIHQSNSTNSTEKHENNYHQFETDKNVPEDHILPIQPLPVDKNTMPSMSLPSEIFNMSKPFTLRKALSNTPIPPPISTYNTLQIPSFSDAGGIFNNYQATTDIFKNMLSGDTSSLTQNLAIPLQDPNASRTNVLDPRAGNASVQPVSNQPTLGSMALGAQNQTNAIMDQAILNNNNLQGFGSFNDLAITSQQNNVFSQQQRAILSKNLSAANSDGNKTNLKNTGIIQSVTKNQQYYGNANVTAFVTFNTRPRSTVVQDYRSTILANATGTNRTDEKIYIDPLTIACRGYVTIDTDQSLYSSAQEKKLRETIPGFDDEINTTHLYLNNPNFFNSTTERPSSISEDSIMRNIGDLSGSRVTNTRIFSTYNKIYHTLQSAPQFKNVTLPNPHEIISLFTRFLAAPIIAPNSNSTIQGNNTGSMGDVLNKAVEDILTSQLGIFVDDRVNVTGKYHKYYNSTSDLKFYNDTARDIAWQNANKTLPHKNFDLMSLLEGKNTLSDKYISQLGYHLNKVSALSSELKHNQSNDNLPVKEGIGITSNTKRINHGPAHLFKDTEKSLHRDHKKKVLSSSSFPSNSHHNSPNTHSPKTSFFGHLHKEFISQYTELYDANTNDNMIKEYWEKINATQNRNMSTFSGYSPSQQAIEITKHRRPYSQNSNPSNIMNNSHDQKQFQSRYQSNPHDRFFAQLNPSKQHNGRYHSQYKGMAGLHHITRGNNIQLGNGKYNNHANLQHPQTLDDIQTKNDDIKYHLSNIAHLLQALSPSTEIDDTLQKKQPLISKNHTVPLFSRPHRSNRNTFSTMNYNMNTLQSESGTTPATSPCTLSVNSASNRVTCVPISSSATKCTPPTTSSFSLDPNHNSFSTFQATVVESPDSMFAISRVPTSTIPASSLWLSESMTQMSYDLDYASINTYPFAIAQLSLRNFSGFEQFTSAKTAKRIFMAVTFRWQVGIQPITAIQFDNLPGISLAPLANIINAAAAPVQAVVQALDIPFLSDIGQFNPNSTIRLSEIALQNPFLWFGQGVHTEDTENVASYSITSPPATHLIGRAIGMLGRSSIPFAMELTRSVHIPAGVMGSTNGQVIAYEYSIPGIYEGATLLNSEYIVDVL